MAAGLGEHGLRGCHGDQTRPNVIGRGSAGHRVSVEHVEHFPPLAERGGSGYHRGHGHV